MPNTLFQRCTDVNHPENIVQDGTYDRGTLSHWLQFIFVSHGWMNEARTVELTAIPGPLKKAEPKLLLQSATRKLAVSKIACDTTINYNKALRRHKGLHNQKEQERGEEAGIGPQRPLSEVSTAYNLRVNSSLHGNTLHRTQRCLTGLSTHTLSLCTINTLYTWVVPESLDLTMWSLRSLTLKSQSSFAKV